MQAYPAAPHERLAGSPCRRIGRESTKEGNICLVFCILNWACFLQSSPLLSGFQWIASWQPLASWIFVRNGKRLKQRNLSYTTSNAYSAWHERLDDDEIEMHLADWCGRVQSEASNVEVR